MCELPDEDYNWVTCSICKTEKFGIKKPLGNDIFSQIRESKHRGWHIILSKAFQGFSCNKCGPKTYLDMHSV